MLLKLFLLSYFISESLGADPFESTFFMRLQCYPQEQPGCSQDFIDAYPKLKWSCTNMTLATTEFYMFTNESPDVPELMHKCAGCLPPNSTFNPKCRTEIFLPGYASGVCNFAIYRELKNERLKSGCYNVLLVDWMWGNFPDLVVAKNNAHIVAQQVAIVIRNIKDAFCLGPEHFILTGHSYGAHIASFITKYEAVGIINGIEPAGVLADFAENSPKGKRLYPCDAPCVQVLHTNAGQCLPNYFGQNFSSGTFDVWYNGGKFQPSCYPQMLISLLKGDIIYALISLIPAACSHLQSLQYYKASMNPDGCQFTGLRCDCVENYKKGKCGRDCDANGEHCTVVGAYGCDCLQCQQPQRQRQWRGRRLQRRQSKNYYLDTDLLCPFCNNSGLNTTGLKCGTETPKCGTETPKCGTETPKCGTETPKCGTETPKCKTEAPWCATKPPPCPNPQQCVPKAPKCETTEASKCETSEDSKCKTSEGSKCQN